jgi:hypothetical protein
MTISSTPTCSCMPNNSNLPSITHLARKLSSCIGRSTWNTSSRTLPPEGPSAPEDQHAGTGVIRPRGSAASISREHRSIDIGSERRSSTDSLRKWKWIVVPYQFSIGVFSRLSITSISTGALRRSNCSPSFLSPSCAAFRPAP